MTWSHRVAVLDLDGTVLDPRRELAPEVEAEIARVHDAGVRVVLATGRPYLATVPLARRLGLRMPVILENGALVVDLETDERLECQPMDRPTLGRLLDVIEPLPRHFITVSGLDELLLEGDHAYLARAIYGGEVPPRARFVSDFGELHGAEATKVWLCAPPASVDRLVAATRDDPGFTFARTMDDSIDATAAGVSKLAALAGLLARWGVGLDEVVAVGDSVNDLDLLAGVGLGIAMGNAPAVVKEAASMATEDNDHGGVAIALREVFPADGRSRPLRDAPASEVAS
jgi:Cof subfamily protein (haloacid dehalogenase superfamily)